jgi:hypothetical protein
VPREKIVAVGLLTQRDLDTLGSGFQRLFRVSQDNPFDDLLRALDQLEEPAPADGHRAPRPVP